MMLILKSILNQIGHNDSCYDSSLLGVPSSTGIFADWDDEDDIISRIHVIDTNFTTGVNCTFFGEYSEKADRFYPIWIPIASSSCKIKGTDEMMKLTIEAEKFTVHYLTNYFEIVLPCYAQCFYSTRFIGIVCSLFQSSTNFLYPKSEFIRLHDM